jgi:hypothetical protein
MNNPNRPSPYQLLLDEGMDPNTAMKKLGIDVEVLESIGRESLLPVPQGRRISLEQLRFNETQVLQEEID